jgi:hypothetical protein
MHRSTRFAWWAAVVALVALTAARPAVAFTHIVIRGDTLAGIAERMYGKIQYEKLLVAANGLDARGGSGIVPGMRLEIPSVGHYRVHRGDTWADLASCLLGDTRRADVLAMSNGSSPWLLCEEAAEILVPYNLTVIVTEADTIVNLAYRYLGNTERAWMLTHYNGLQKSELRRGDVLLVPLTDLELTAAGKQAAELSAGRTQSEAEGQQRADQQRVRSELPALLADVRQGRYIDAVRRGNRFLAASSLTREQLGTIHRQLLEAYAALDAPGLAASSCASWLQFDSHAQLDPVLLSPKIIAACRRSTQ